MPQSISNQQLNWDGVEFEVFNNRIVFPMFSMSGRLFAVHMVNPEKKDYKTVIGEGLNFIPCMYATKRDYENLYRSKKAILVEGLFDRAVFSRCLPEYACFARLSTGVTQRIARYFNRYADLVVIGFDSDMAGDKGYKKAERAISSTVTRLKLPFHDAGDMAEERGIEWSKDYLQRRLQLLLS